MANTPESMLTLILEWIWVPIASALVALGLRVIALEKQQSKDKSDTDRKLAVDKNEIDNLKEKIVHLESKNTSEHGEIKALVHAHHEQVIGLLTSIKNGNK